MERAKRYDSVITLLMLDLDHFKGINDTAGHLVGDDVLREVAALLQESIRSVDLVARYGGEEFVVVLPETGAGGRGEVRRAHARAVERTAFTPAHGGVRLTASIGVASYPAPRRHRRGRPLCPGGRGAVSRQGRRAEQGVHVSMSTRCPTCGSVYA